MRNRREVEGIDRVCCFRLIMAPRKRTQNAKTKKNPKTPKLEAFLLDFDDEGNLHLSHKVYMMIRLERFMFVLCLQFIPLWKD